MTAKRLFDLHANSSILASHSQTTGKMRCVLHSRHFHIFSLTEHTVTHKYASSWASCPEAKNQLEIPLHVLSEKLAKNCKGQHVFVLWLGRGSELQL